jgi:hypothetical protein
MFNVANNPHICADYFVKKTMKIFEISKYSLIKLLMLIGFGFDLRYNSVVHHMTIRPLFLQIQRTLFNTHPPSIGIEHLGNIIKKAKYNLNQIELEYL